MFHQQGRNSKTKDVLMRRRYDASLSPSWAGHAHGTWSYMESERFPNFEFLDVHELES